MKNNLDVGGKRVNICRKLKFKDPMKIILVSLILALGMTAHASQEWRTFTSVDGQRTFKGQLTAFDAGSSTVTVLNSKGQRISFKIDVISEDDREYVIANSSKLSPDTNLRIRFGTLRERKDAARGDGTRTTTHDGGYTIFVNSFSPRIIADAEVEYALIYRKDQVNGEHSDHVIKGSDTVEIPPNSSAAVRTETVDLVNFYKAGEVSVSGAGGGCRGGSCGKGSSTATATRSQRSRDSLIGCVARVIVDGKVVSVGATSPDILKKYGSELGDDYEN